MPAFAAAAVAAAAIAFYLFSRYFAAAAFIAQHRRRIAVITHHCRRRCCTSICIALHLPSPPLFALTHCCPFAVIAVCIAAAAAAICCAFAICTTLHLFSLPLLHCHLPLFAAAAIHHFIAVLHCTLHRFAAFAFICTPFALLLLHLQAFAAALHLLPLSPPFAAAQQQQHLHYRRCYLPFALLHHCIYLLLLYCCHLFISNCCHLLYRRTPPFALHHLHICIAPFALPTTHLLHLQHLRRFAFIICTISIAVFAAISICICRCICTAAVCIIYCISNLLPPYYIAISFIARH